MSRFPDVSEFFTPDRAVQEEASWLLEGPQPRQCLFLRPRLVEHKIRSIIEFGCGSGILAAMLPGEIAYQGIDRNEWFLNRARKRNAHLGDKRELHCTNIRDWASNVADLAMCWGFLKHFALDEWNAILARVLTHGRFGAFDVQITADDFDNGEEFHHTFITEDRLARALAAAGHEEVERELMEEFTLATSQPIKVFALWTKKLPQEASPQLGSWRHELTVGDKDAFDLGNYSLRWTQQGAGWVPVLYHQGRRVTSAWQGHFQMNMPADESGGNANTA